MAYEQILYDVGDHIATITLNRPERLNAWTPQMGRELYAAFAAAAADAAVRVIVVTGAGRGFCSGADMQALRDIQSAAKSGGGEVAAPDAAGDLAAPSIAPLHPALDTPYAYPQSIPKPVLAAINGPVAGLGFTHMLYYDIRIASDRARFTTAFARRGLISEHGSSWMLPRLVGPAHACDLLFSGRVIDAAEAQAMGLVNAVVPHEELLPRVYERATELATLNSPRSIAVMKRLVYTHQFVDLATASAETDREMLASFPSEDFREGVASFLEKRPPRFVGR
ncbi:MAG: enoyl-CoA hydratase [Polyangiaceae bacterium UTPRO1]|jgi:enoyl-CoA hydratase/carnithine racemase|nr:enoyl-CoA hydratase [Myxococcales bacterium]OQY67952.1 MAG: enoyl-CoA hydratase [Polyangiaceae bacterium UTPRO1]